VYVKRGKDFYQSSNEVSCWWCCHGFDTLPLGCPMNERGQWDGNFCSWSCVLAWSRAKGDGRVNGRQMWIRLAMKRLHTVPLSKQLFPAPPREALRIFGGELDIDMFRETQMTFVEDSAIRKTIIPFEREILMLGGLRVIKEGTKDRTVKTQRCLIKPSPLPTSRRRPLRWAPSKQCMEGQVSRPSSSQLPKSSYHL